MTTDDGDLGMVALIDFAPRQEDTPELRERIQQLAEAVDGLPDGTYVTIKVTSKEEM